MTAPMMISPMTVILILDDTEWAGHTNVTYLSQ
jgi:hypothetical protein